MISCQPQPVHGLRYGPIRPAAIVENAKPKPDKTDCNRAEVLAAQMTRRFYGDREHLSGTLTHQGVRYSLRQRYGTPQEDGRYGDELDVLIAQTGSYKLTVYLEA